MEPYANKSGNSGIVKYEIEPTLIKIQFENGGTYAYHASEIGEENFKEMKRLAQEGEGLNAFMSCKDKREQIHQKGKKVN